LSFDSVSGTLDIVQTVPSLPGSFTEKSAAADVHIHPSGKFLYVSNRGHDSIAIFAIDNHSGMLSYLGWQPSKGRIPRSFVIDPTGTFLLVANQDSDNIATFRINQHSGLLVDTSHDAYVPTPVCLKMFLL
jgi:6-phosphogluconolactonase